MQPDDLLKRCFAYQASLVGYAYVILQDWGLAEDAVQEAFLILQKKAQEYDSAQNDFAWVRRMVRYRCLKILESRKRESCLVDEELLGLIDAHYESWEDDGRNDRLERQKAALRRCMALLSPDSLGLILGFYRDRIPCEALAKMKERSVNAIYLALSRIRARLRECVMGQLRISADHE